MKGVLEDPRIKLQHMLLLKQLRQSITWPHAYTELVMQAQSTVPAYGDVQRLYYWSIHTLVCVSSIL